MITLNRKQTIIYLYLKGGKRKNSKETKKSRNTVNKYIREYEKKQAEGCSRLTHCGEYCKTPAYKKRGWQKQGVNGKGQIHFMWLHKGK